jgi:hypothetical protein
MNLAKIRSDLVRFIEGKMSNQGAKLQDVNLLEAPRCPLINPACPSDLCILPAGHPGTEDHVHILGTDNYGYATRYDFPMAEVGTSDEDLRRLGWDEQDRRFPDERHPG